MNTIAEIFTIYTDVT